MAIRDDFTIDWGQSPRVITVASPSVEVTMQSLLDTLRWLESQPSAMDDAAIVDASGKETLDATTKVGITVTLQNAIIGFEARTGTEYGGVDEWTICSLVGGNLVAIDASGGIIESVNPTAFVTVKAQSSSSATLQEQDALQYSSYGNQVSLNSTSAYTGTAYPIGNMQYPVNNAQDTVSICHNKGFHKIGLAGSYNFIAGDNISGLKVEGISHVTTFIDMGYDAICLGTIFNNVDITGILDGNSEISNCVAYDIVFFNGHIHDSAIGGTFSLGGSTPAKFVNCSMADVTNPLIIDCGGSGQNAIIDYMGMVTIQNLTGASTIALSMRGGVVTLDSTCTAGNITIQGNFEIIDNSGDGCSVNINEKLTVVSDLTELSTDSPTAEEIAIEVWSTELPLNITLYPRFTLYPSTTLYPTGVV